MPKTESSQKRNKNTFVSILAISVGMFAMAYAAVPLYDLFCRVTGYGGTPQRVEAMHVEPGKTEVTVLFNADVMDKMPWDFKPSQRKVTVPTGKDTLVFFEAKNRSDKPVAGISTFNVTPSKAGQYFSKIQCFCFDEQLLQPGEHVDMPVSFYVDPAIENDPDTKEIKAITLSYTFFEVKD